MEGPVLDQHELDAIRQSMAEVVASPSRAASVQAAEATPIALIADDRAAERARPSGLRLAQRWATVATRRLGRMTGLKVRIEATGAETLDGAALRDTLGASWVHALDAKARPGFALVAVSGPVIDTIAGRLLGSSPDEDAPDRAPSAAALKIFTPAGLALADSAAEAWSEEQGCDVTVRRDSGHFEGWRRDLLEVDMVVVVTLTISGAARGTLRLLARPETLVPPPAPVEAVPAPPGAIEEALGAVPVELTVELGKKKITMAALRALAPGQVIPLDRFVDDPLPIRVGGVIKACGRALVSRGAIAVEVTSRLAKAPQKGNPR